MLCLPVQGPLIVLVPGVWKGQCIPLTLVCLLDMQDRVCSGKSYGPWDHVLPYVWTDKSNPTTTQDEGEDEVELRVCVALSQALHRHSLSLL